MRLAAALLLVAGVALARTKVTVWATGGAAAPAYGGQTYGGSAPVSGALVSEQREVDLGTTGEVRIPGVAQTIDPASVQLRDLTDPTATIAEQRFLDGARTPTEILAHHAGETVTVVTAKGELTGVLRSVDEQVLVLELGTGDQRHLQVMRRDGYVQDVKLPVGSGIDKPTLVWRIAAKKLGRHTVELTYRADGMVWTADYLAVLDDAGTAVDFSAWATVKNTSGATYENAELTLVTGGAPVQPGPAALGKPVAGAPVRYAIAAPVRVGAGQQTQVPLMPPVRAAKARAVVTFEAMADPSLGFQAYPNSDCNQNNGVGMGNGRAESAIELDVPTTGPLPDGRVRMFRRRADRMEVLSEEPLRSATGVARIRIGNSADITGERHAVSCNFDERARTVTEKVEVTVANKGKRAAEVVIREFAWRWPAWRLDGEDAKSTRGGAQTLEYRASLPAGGKKSVTYSVVYAW